jgi:hypothetical protein
MIIDALECIIYLHSVIHFLSSVFDSTQSATFSYYSSAHDGTGVAACSRKGNELRIPPIQRTRNQRKETKVRNKHGEEREE